MKILRLSAIAILSVTFTFNAPVARAEDWSYDLAVYGFAAGLDGRVGIGTVEADVDVPFSDLLENLELGGMAFFKARKGKWGLMSDTVFAGLGATKGPADVDVDMLIQELDATYRVTEVVEIFFGARYFDVDADIGFLGPVGLGARAGDDWIGPLAGVRIQKPIAKRWTFYGRRDLGGFGVGSDFSYHLGLNFGYRASDRLSIILGYRLLDVDYDDGEGPDRFLFDVQISNPLGGIVIHF